MEYKIRYTEDEGFGFVVRGNLEVEIDNEKKIVNKGACFYLFFDNNLSLKNLSKRDAEIIMVNY